MTSKNAYKICIDWNSYKMDKDFDKWNKLKKEIEKQEINQFFKE